MRKKNETEKLYDAIVLLQNKRENDFLLLKEQLHFTYESLKPINILKTTLHEVASSPDIKNNIVNNVIGIATGYLSKKVLFGSTHNPIKRLTGTLLQFAISNVVSKHSETIKSAGEKVLMRILRFRKESRQDSQIKDNAQ